MSYQTSTYDDWSPFPDVPARPTLDVCFLFTTATARKLGWKLVFCKNHLLRVPVPTFTKCVHSKCTGTHFYKLCLDQSETHEVGRAQDCSKQHPIPVASRSVLVLVPGHRIGIMKATKAIWNYLESVWMSFWKHLEVLTF